MKMTKKSWSALAGLTVSVLVIGSLFQNCSAPEMTETGVVDANSSSSTNKFAIVPSNVNIMVDGQQSFAITGGTTPYTWSLSPADCGGFDTATKTFTASSVGGISCTLAIRDANNKTVRSTISIAENALSATFSPNPATVTTNIQILSSGGTPPYTYTLVSGGGQLVSSVYKTPDSAETAVVRVSDTNGKTYDVTILVAGGGSNSGTGGAGTQRVFRSANGRTGDVMHTKQQGEAASLGYADQPTAALTVFSASGSGRVDIRRCFTGRSHMVGIGSCAGGDEGSLGFLSSSSVSGASRQIFLCSNGISTFLSSNNAECNGAGQPAGFAP